VACGGIDAPASEYLKYTRKYAILTLNNQKFSGELPTPGGEGDTPSPHSTPLGASILRPYRHFFHSTSSPEYYAIMRYANAYYVNTLHDLWLFLVNQNKSHNALLIVVKNILDLRPYLLVPILLAIDGNTFVCSYD